LKLKKKTKKRWNLKRRQKIWREKRKKESNKRCTELAMLPSASSTSTATQFMASIEDRFEKTEGEINGLTNTKREVTT